jgi:DNA-binding ferritin-like protein (Dps family)
MNFLKFLIATLIGMFAPAVPLLLAVGFLIFADFATGIWAAYKRGEVITKSSGWRRSVTKIAVYNFAVLSGFIIETHMLNEVLPVSKIIASVIGLVELKSILENSNTILGGDLFKMVIARLGSDNDALKEQIKQQIKDEVDKQLK